MTIALLKTKDPGFKSAFQKILRRGEINEETVEMTVREIIKTVRRQGDRALIDYARRFDGVRLTGSTLEIHGKEIDQALNQVSSADLSALRLAAKRIAAFHRHQLEKSWSYRDPVGLVLGQKITPLNRVGVYVPGGKASYPSTVLMNAIPAKVAGVKEIIMTSPLGKNSAPILAAAKIAGVDRIFRVGGAQAIAALAFGTESIPKVDKIVGPGNIYVATAKRLVFGQVGIDSIAGPSEILLLVDDSVNPEFVAADMLSQAEHDELAAAFCVTASLSFALKIKAAVERQVKEAQRQAITVKALEKYGAIIVSRTLKEGAEIANAIAPEHVEILVRQPRKWAAAIRNAGAIFIGPYATPPLGDYMAGPNHVLPTGGSARFFSPLGSYDFLKRTSLIEANAEALRRLGPKVARFAKLEGLYDHARAVEIRLKKPGVK